MIIGILSCAIFTLFWGVQTVLGKYNNIESAIQLPEQDIFDPGGGGSGGDSSSNIWKGSGTAGDPYQMEDVQDILTLSNNLNNYTSNPTVAHYNATYFRLENDLDFTGISFDGIGVANQISFNGSFDGQNYTISNLNINTAINKGSEGIINAADSLS